jgi:uncharacterized protein YndB with AHSA1/START domain
MKLTQYTIERKFTAPPERVYRAFTDPAELAAWVWGEFAQTASAEIDLTINGTFGISIDEGQGLRSAMRGIYLVIEPNKRLIHTVHWDASVGYNESGKALDEILVIDFVAEGTGCWLRYLHMGIPDDGRSAAAHEKSVRSTLDSLEKHLDGKG